MSIYDAQHFIKEVKYEMTSIRQHPNANVKYKVQESIEQPASGSPTNANVKYNVSGSPLNANVLTQRPFPL